MSLHSSIPSSPPLSYPSSSPSSSPPSPNQFPTTKHLAYQYLSNVIRQAAIAAAGPVPVLTCKYCGSNSHKKKIVGNVPMQSGKSDPTHLGHWNTYCVKADKPDFVFTGYGEPREALLPYLFSLYSIFRELKATDHREIKQGNFTSATIVPPGFPHPFPLPSYTPETFYHQITSPIPDFSAAQDGHISTFNPLPMSTDMPTHVRQPTAPTPGRNSPTLSSTASAPATPTPIRRCLSIRTLIDNSSTPPSPPSNHTTRDGATTIPTTIPTSVSSYPLGRIARGDTESTDDFFMSTPLRWRLLDRVDVAVGNSDPMEDLMMSSPPRNRLYNNVGAAGLDDLPNSSPPPSLGTVPATYAGSHHGSVLSLDSDGNPTSNPLKRKATSEADDEATVIVVSSDSEGDEDEVADMVIGHHHTRSWNLIVNDMNGVHHHTQCRTLHERTVLGGHIMKACRRVLRREPNGLLLYAVVGYPPQRIMRGGRYRFSHRNSLYVREEEQD